MCISDLNPQMQFENLNMSSKIISPIKKQNKPTARVNEPVTHHLAATIRPTTEERTTPYPTPSTAWPTASSIAWETSSFHSAISRTTETTLTTTHELGVTRSYEKYHNEPIKRLEFDWIQS